jgi:hypothetical protein
VSNNRLKFDGLQELKKSLRELPVLLHGEAENEVDAEANQAALEIRQAYKIRSGKLVEGVVVERVERSRFFAGRRVVSKSPLAMIYENGTQVRHTDLGYNRGRMPPAHVFIPAMIRHRKEMYDRLRDLMRRHGLKVIG